MLIEQKIDIKTFKFEDADEIYLDFETDCDELDENVESKLTQQQAQILLKHFDEVEQGLEPDYTAWNAVCADVREQLGLSNSNMLSVIDVRVIRASTGEVFTTI